MISVTTVLVKMELATPHLSAHPGEVLAVDLVRTDMVFAAHSHSAAEERAARIRPTLTPRQPSEPASAQPPSAKSTQTFVSSESTLALSSSPAQTLSHSQTLLSFPATRLLPVVPLPLHAQDV